MRGIANREVVCIGSSQDTVDHERSSIAAVFLSDTKRGLRCLRRSLIFISCYTIPQGLSPDGAVNPQGNISPFSPDASNWLKARNIAVS
jgi:hypothetical protein